MHTTDRFAPIRAWMMTDVYKLGHIEQYRLCLLYTSRCV